MLWPFKKKAAAFEEWNLSTPLLYWSPRDPWTLGDACQGCQIWGATGSGKSSGSFAAILGAYLTAGFGGCFLTSKIEDTQRYLRLCKFFGRQEDVMIFGPNWPLRYNFINAELARTDAGAGLVENLTALLSTVLEANERKSGGGGRDDDSYWKRSTMQLVHEAISLLVLAKGTVTIPELYELVIAAPISPEQLRSEEWKQNSYCMRCLRDADRMPKTARQAADFELTSAFFLIEWCNLSDRTRSVILSTFSGLIHVLNRGIARDLLSSPVTNVTPDMAAEGKLIILDAPVKLYGDVGRFLQIVWKFCYQQAQERRDINENPRATFIAADESHLFSVTSDQLFQTTARSSRTCVVNATQSVSNYLAAFGGEKAEAEVHSLLGNLQNQIFHQQTDVRTNTYAAELFGKSRQFLTNASNSYQSEDWMQIGLGHRAPGHSNTGVTEVIDYQVQPSVFTGLRKGGPPSWDVEGIVFQGGKRFQQTGKTWMNVKFKQQL